MAVLGLLFALLDSLSKAIDTLLNKSIMRTRSAGEHAVLRIVFVIPLLFAASLFNWSFKRGCVVYLLAYGLLEAVNILFHQLAVKRSNPLHSELISKSKVRFAMAMAFVLTSDTLSFVSVVGIIVFVAGAVLTINYQSRGDERTDAVGIIMETVSVLARTFKPFVLKTCVQRELISNETMAFLSMVVALVVLWAAFRPRVSVKEVPVKQYFLQAAIGAAGMLFSGWAVIYANIVIVNAIASTSVIFVMLISALCFRKKYPAVTVAGCLLSILGLAVSVIF